MTSLSSLLGHKLQYIGHGFFGIVFVAEDAFFGGDPVIIKMTSHLPGKQNQRQRWLASQNPPLSLPIIHEMHGSWVPQHVLKKVIVEQKIKNLNAHTEFWYEKHRTVDLVRMKGIKDYFANTISLPSQTFADNSLLSGPTGSMPQSVEERGKSIFVQGIPLDREICRILLSPVSQLRTIIMPFADKVPIEMEDQVLPFMVKIGRMFPQNMLDLKPSHIRYYKGNLVVIDAMCYHDKRYKGRALPIPNYVKMFYKSLDRDV